jgi:hypothetical protein
MYCVPLVFWINAPSVPPQQSATKLAVLNRSVVVVVVAAGTSQQDRCRQLCLVRGGIAGDSLCVQQHQGRRF